MYSVFAIITIMDRSMKLLIKNVLKVHGHERCGGCNADKSSSPFLHVMSY